MLTPRDETDLAEAIAGATGPLAVIGGGTRGSGRTPVGTPLSVAGLSGITLYEPGALTMVAKAGTPLSEVEAALDAEGQMLAFEPPDLTGITRGEGPSTIGGVFATNASGARRIQGGAARDHLLGVRFVDGQGTIVKNGGRVMKNVTGYDLVKLMAGSHGTLGVLTEVSFKVLPKPEAMATIEINNLSDEDAIAAMSSAMTSPFDVSGAVHAPACIEEEPTTLIRVEGFTDSVKYRAERLEERLATFGEIQCVEGRESWASVRGNASLSQTVRGAEGAVWSVFLKPSNAPAYITTLAERFGCLYEYNWAGGRIDIWLGAGKDLPGFHAALQAAAAKAGGHARLIHGPGTLADAVSIFQPEAAPLAKLAEGLRRQFDPRGILNPGLMG